MTQPTGHRPALPYNPALDGLRGVAILLVILSHAHAPLFEGAFYGVDLFFVLSGYLITSLLLQEVDRSGRIAYWRFYRRRLYRLMPALALFLLAYCLLAPLVWPDLRDVYSDALVSFLYLADYGIAFFDSPDTLLHMWSLAVEEHFYLVWPPLLMLLLRTSPAGLRWRPIALLWLLAWAWRLLWVAQGQQFYEIFFRFDTRASGLLLGSLLAVLLAEQPAWFTALRQRLAHGMWLVLAVPLLMAHTWDDMNAMVWGLTVVECATLVVLASVQRASSPLHEMLRSPALVWVGKLSYGIYLWHYPIVRYLRADWHWSVTAALGFALSALLAWVSLATVERWALRLRDRSPARAGAAARHHKGKNSFSGASAVGANP
jgi:peptidoglycan/LPS O-acetylase OafA/YrhL